MVAVPSASRVWLGAALTTAITTLLALVLWRVTGAPWVWVAVPAGLAALVVYHSRNLLVLAEWLRRPFGVSLPAASGPWGGVFSALDRRAKIVSEEKAELSSALSRFIDAAQAMPDGVMSLGPQNVIEWMNRSAENHFGLDAAQDSGAPITNLVRQPDFVEYMGAGHFGEVFVMRNTRVPGQTLAIQVVPFGAQRKLVIARDITPLERLETMRQDFVANVSHELKTPLTVVSGFLETLSDNLHDMTPDEAMRMLRLAHEQGRRMQQLVEDLLTLARLETGSPPPLDEEVDVAILLAEVACEAQALSAGRHRIEVDPGPHVRIVGSAAELRSAFGNLATNAVRYTPAGGRVRLRWNVLADGTGMYSVEDTGIGIEARHVPRLTERFYRIDRGRSRESGGTGLGLAIVKHVLTRHQATLDVQSEPGRGSFFTVRIPAKRVLTLKPVCGAAK